MADAANLSVFLIEPSESLAVEYKAWLNLKDPEHRGTLAKAMIALANEGGGHLVLGFSDDGPELLPLPPPADFVPYDQDTVNDIVRKFADPNFHCTLTSVTHPASGAVHQIVSVPGGHGVPVMSRAGTQNGSIVAQVCYVRKPGPASGPALTQAEWSRLLDRCVKNRQTDMLDAIRSIVLGRVDTGNLPSGSAQERQDEFVAKASERWLGLTGTLDPEHPSRSPRGRYEVDFSFETGEAIRLPTLLEHMNSASRIKLTGWPPFWLPTRPEIAPYPIDGSVECWLGRPETSRLPDDAAHSDFWRVTPEVRAFLVRGYQEDGLENKPPGTLFDATLPIWRIGEIILFAGRLATALQVDGQLQFRVRWSGLNGRMLTFVSDWSRSTGGRHAASQDAVQAAASIPLARIEENLPEILHPLLQPLYEAFGFFELPGWLVAQELAKMRKQG